MKRLSLLAASLALAASANAATVTFQYGLSGFRLELNSPFKFNAMI